MSTDERNAGRITLKVGGRPIAPALAEREHELATTTTPSTVAPHLTRALTDYMALTAPEDPMREDVARAIHDAWNISGIPYDSEYIKGNVFRGGKLEDQADAAIAAAEPHLRARHRAELLAELAEAADRDPLDLLLNIPNGISAINAGAVTAEWLRLQADATRPVEGRGE